MIWFVHMWSFNTRLIHLWNSWTKSSDVSCMFEKIAILSTSSICLLDLYVKWISSVIGKLTGSLEITPVVTVKIYEPGATFKNKFPGSRLFQDLLPSPPPPLPSTAPSPPPPPPLWLNRPKVTCQNGSNMVSNSPAKWWRHAVVTGSRCCYVPLVHWFCVVIGLIVVQDRLSVKRLTWQWRIVMYHFVSELYIKYCHSNPLKEKKAEKTPRSIWDLFVCSFACLLFCFSTSCIMGIIFRLDYHDIYIIAQAMLQNPILWSLYNGALDTGPWIRIRCGSEIRIQRPLRLHTALLQIQAVCCAAWQCVIAMRVVCVPCGAHVRPHWIQIGDPDPVNPVSVWRAPLYML